MRAHLFRSSSVYFLASGAAASSFCDCEPLWARFFTCCMVSGCKEARVQCKRQRERRSRERGRKEGRKKNVERERSLEAFVCAVTCVHDTTYRCVNSHEPKSRPSFLPSVVSLMLCLSLLPLPSPFFSLCPLSPLFLSPLSPPSFSPLFLLSLPFFR